MSPALGLATTVAVLFHEIPQELGDFGILIHSGLSVRRAVLLNLASASAAILGAVAALLLGAVSGAAVTMLLVPITAGGFVYIAAADLMPELQHDRTRPRLAHPGRPDLPGDGRDGASRRSWSDAAGVGVARGPAIAGSAGVSRDDATRARPRAGSGSRARRRRGTPRSAFSMARRARSGSVPAASLSRGRRMISVKRVTPSVRSTVPSAVTSQVANSTREARATARRVNRKHVSTAANRRCSGLHASPGPSKSRGGALRRSGSPSAVASAWPLGASAEPDRVAVGQGLHRRTPLWLTPGTSLSRDAGRSDREHRARGRLDHVMRDRAKHPADDARPAVSAHDDEVGGMLLGAVDDLFARDSPGDRCTWIRSRGSVDRSRNRSTSMRPCSWRSWAIRPIVSAGHVSDRRPART